MRRFIVISVGALSAAVIAACGSSSSSSGSTATGGGGNGEDQKSAQDILTDTATAFGNVAAYTVTSTGTDKSGQNSATYTGAKDSLTGSGSVAITSSSGTPATTPFKIVITGGTVYFSQGGSPFQALDQATALPFLSLLVAKAASCLPSNHGTLTKVGVSTVGGRQVVEIKDDGKAPGSSPGSLFVSLDGAPLPVRTVSTGPQTPGGDKSCGAVDDSTTISQQNDFSYSSSAPTVTAPPTAASTDTGSQSASSSSS